MQRTTYQQHAGNQLLTAMLRSDKVLNESHLHMKVGSDFLWCCIELLEIQPLAEFAGSIHSGRCRQENNREKQLHDEGDRFER